MAAPGMRPEEWRRMAVGLSGGALLRERRERAGLTVQDLADGGADWSPQVIAGIERQHSVPVHAVVRYIGALERAQRRRREQ
jgi:transcriptional regulator with XRE-family HTH domain